MTETGDLFDDAVRTASMQLDGTRLGSAASMAAFAVRCAYTIAVKPLSGHADMDPFTLTALIRETFAAAWATYLDQGTDVEEG